MTRASIDRAHQPKTASRPLRIFIVTGEHSGDALGAKLMAALRVVHSQPLDYNGVGGEAMEAEGLHSLYPLADVAVMGPLHILPKLPRIVSRVYRTVTAALAFEPDVVVIIDAPEFTHPIAKRIRKRRPDIPIINYVSPSVWAWRPGRARKMKPYVDHLLALLPFEPEAHERLGGPPCTYVGHPLIERRTWMQGIDAQPLVDRFALEPDIPVLVVLPGSRASEVDRLIGPFGETVARMTAGERPLNVLMPTLPHLAERVAIATASWPAPTFLVKGEEDKFRAFKLAKAALAASGTVTLELALAGTPMVVAYKVDQLAAQLRFLVKVPSIVLANLVLGRRAFPEFIQEDCEAGRLSTALGQLLTDTPEREAQLAALSEIADRMAPPSGSPSVAAAEIVLRYAKLR